jgi:hypothetical protein
MATPHDEDLLDGSLIKEIVHSHSGTDKELPTIIAQLYALQNCPTSSLLQNQIQSHNLH